MINKKIIVNLPDEPYKKSFTKNKTVEISYTGPKFLVVSYDDSTKKVQSIDGYFNFESEITIEDFEKKEYNYFVLDTEQNILIAALLTNSYTQTEVGEYQEDLPDGSTWIYGYSQNFILDELFDRFNLSVDVEKNKINEPEYRSFPIDRTQFLKNLKLCIDVFILDKNKAIENGETEDVLNHYDKQIKWCQDFEKNYKDVDHWKVQFPKLK